MVFKNLCVIMKVAFALEGLIHVVSDLWGYRKGMMLGGDTGFPLCSQGTSLERRACVLRRKTNSCVLKTRSVAPSRSASGSPRAADAARSPCAWPHPAQIRPNAARERVRLVCVNPSTRVWVRQFSYVFLTNLRGHDFKMYFLTIRKNNCDWLHL